MSRATSSIRRSRSSHSVSYRTTSKTLFDEETASVDSHPETIDDVNNRISPVTIAARGRNAIQRSGMNDPAFRGSPFGCDRAGLPNPPYQRDSRIRPTIAGYPFMLMACQFVAHIRRTRRTARRAGLSRRSLFFCFIAFCGPDAPQRLNKAFRETQLETRSEMASKRASEKASKEASRKQRWTKAATCTVSFIAGDRRRPAGQTHGDQRTKKPRGPSFSVDSMAHSPP